MCNPISGGCKSGIPIVIAGSFPTCGAVAELSIGQAVGSDLRREVSDNMSIPAAASLILRWVRKNALCVGQNAV